ncbi:MAG: SAF domain-containing protein [Candidatus Melainabacteria bacterium]|jgi:flagella basal body P-ring formation protein FlgA|nr:SAF domain-containing protein [Candidatus Melainabacteria bacterium]
MALLNRNTGFILGNVLGMALLIGGIIVTAPQKQAEQAEIDKRNSAPVVMAVSDIKAGDKIAAELVKQDRIAHEKVPLNAVDSIEKIKGLSAKSDIKKGDVVTYSALDLHSQSK